MTPDLFPWLEDFDEGMDVPPMGPAPDPWEMPEYPTPRGERFSALLDELMASRMEANQPEGFLDRFAMGLQSAPPRMSAPPQNGMEAFLGGLIPSAAQGFSQGRIQSRGLAKPDLSGRMEMLKLAGMGAQQEVAANNARLSAAIRQQGIRAGVERSAVPKPAAPPDYSKPQPGETQAAFRARQLREMRENAEATRAPKEVGGASDFDKQRAGESDAAYLQRVQALAAAKQKPVDKTKDKQRADYAMRLKERVSDSVNEVIGRVGPLTAGVGGRIMRLSPGSGATDLAADLKQIAGNIAFEALQEMRDASKTGGALGPVSDMEIKLLSSVLGSLDQDQSEGNLRRNLTKIKDSADYYGYAANAVANDQPIMPKAQWLAQRDAPPKTAAPGVADSAEVARARAFLRGGR